ncbi:O-antigen ligase family protein [Deinococcus oregonensis]|uniref:O-antigen ligase family protein n=1 Tax=Deinococcus oregonensis TaxID=1805970 RepID=A0ABV6AWU3_9DEIO
MTETNSKTTWILAPLALFMFFVPNFSGDQIFQLDKIYLLTTFLVLFGGVIFLTRQNYRNALTKPVFFLLLGYMIWTYFTNTLLSSHPEYTLIGWPKWYGGYFFHALLTILFLMSGLLSRIRPKIPTFTYIDVLFFFSILLCLLCILEMLGFNPILGSKWLALLGAKVSDTSSMSYPTVTLGNSGWVAGMWLLLAPLPFLLKQNRPTQVILWHTVNALGIASTHSKAVLGIYVVMHIGAVIWSLRKKTRNVLFTSLLSICIACLGLSALRAANTLLYRAGAPVRDANKIIFNAANYEGSLTDRLIIYKSTLKLIQERPLQGWGYETLHYNFYRPLSESDTTAFISRVLPPKKDEIVHLKGNFIYTTPKDQPSTITQAQIYFMVKPHNALLEEWYSNGLIGLGLILSALVLCVRQILRNGGFEEKILLLSCVLYGAYLMLWFTTIGVTPLAVVLLAFALRGSQPSPTTVKV